MSQGHRSSILWRKSGISCGHRGGRGKRENENFDPRNIAGREVDTFPIARELGGVVRVSLFEERDLLAASDSGERSHFSVKVYRTSFVKSWITILDLRKVKYATMDRER